ncbi:DUF4087 domain-containing protein [Kamptonema animale CS-326]|jgi:hypothetical protein|uniref:DUF4087 domain-containing protein n=1 Tax=Kamptonema animale TaxID=92934 RepID=UPI00232B7DE0|nr:DUF4087 domain-containing protein [Kamptonema animale]MDB9514166.1 DUF4087 domain-containing protein [Kamptonema animale CS-326]
MIRVRKRSWLILAIISFISVIALPVKATETRCGWLANPTPANWYLKDGDGTWVISMQGGYQAEGMENLPSDEKEYVKTNGYHGYGCACLDVSTNSNRMRIIAIHSGEALPLSTCREDPNLPKE